MLRSHSGNAIPPDDIMEEYMKLPESTRSAVSNMIRGEWHVAAVTNTVGPGMSEPEILADWQADQTYSMYMLLGLISVGRNQFGEVWLNSLKHHLSLME